MIKPMVEPHEDCFHRVRWDDGETNTVMLSNIPEIWLDFIGFMVARRLLKYDYSPDRPLIVRLQGADFELIRCPLGIAPLNFAKPVSQPIHCSYREAGA